MSEKEYTRLTRARRRLGEGVLTVSASFASLWLGRDHLLCIDGTGFSEEYKRFYFRDIQAFTLRRTSRRLVIALLLGVPLALLLLMAAANLGSTGDETGFWVCTCLAVIFGVPFLYNLFAGPSVRCYLQTAVQTEELPPLNRLRRANKVINRLRPLIAQAQGEISREELPQRVAEVQAAAAAEAAASTRAQNYVAPSVSPSLSAPSPLVDTPPPGEVPPVL
ncbi:MAG TPA: hypothetical protein VHC95_10690 [Opitutales bacterium]|nr:hypothetical protein [Opitutales bacterium]